MRLIKLNQGFRIVLHLSVCRFFQVFPVKSFIFCPFMYLTIFLSHKQKFFTRMCHKKAIRCTQICELFILGSRHLLQQRSFLVYHFIMG